VRSVEPRVSARSLIVLTEEPSLSKTSRSSGGSMLTSAFGLLGVVIVGALLVTAVFARPTTVSTNTDEVALHYSGGPFSSTKWLNCVPQSQREWDGPYDKHFKYPSSQTNFVFGPGGEPGYEQGITFVSKDGIEMTVYGVANVLLNTECEVLRQFHDLIGNRYGAYLDGDGSRSAGWTNKVLPIYIGKPLNTAIDRASQAYNYKALYNDPNVKAQWERDVLEALPELVNRQTDGEEDFFINFALTLEKPEPPQSIKDALLKEQSDVASANARKAEAEAQQAAAEAQIQVEKANAAQIEELVKVLGLNGYLRKLAIENGQNPFQPQTDSLIANP